MSRTVCAKTTLLLTLALLASPSTAQADAPIDTPDALTQALAQAEPGDEVLIASGRYENWDVELKDQGKKDAPIVIRPAEPGGVIFTGENRFLFTGDHLTLRGLTFDGVVSDQYNGVIFFRGSNHCRITDSTFIHARLTSSDTLVVFEQSAADNRLDHCIFDDIRTRSVRIAIDNHSLEHGPPVRNRIDHNLFMNIPPLGRNGGETIQIGSRAYPYSRLESHTLVEENTFLRCNGEGEIVCVKSTANTIRGNRFLHCDGQLSLRHGGGNTVQENLFLDCVIGVRISGPNQIVTGNTIINARDSGIVLWYGTPDAKHPAAYLPVHDCVIKDNTIIHSDKAGIFIGANRNQKWHNNRWAKMSYGSRRADLRITMPPHNNTITGNTITGDSGSLIVENHAPENTIESNTLIDRE